MELKRLHILRNLSLVGVSISFFQSLLFYFFLDSLLWAMMCLLVVGLFVLVYYFIKTNRFALARNFYFLFIILFIGVFRLLLGKGVGMLLYYFPVCSLLFILYKYPQEKKPIYSFLLLISLSFTVAFWVENHYEYFDLSSFHEDVFYRINFFTSIFISVIATYYFVSVNIKNEKELDKYDFNLAAMFNGTAEVIFIIDKQYNILDVNRAAIEQVRAVYHIEPKQGTPVLNYLSLEMRDNYKAYLEKCFQGHEVEYDREVKGITGDMFYYEIKMEPLRDAVGNIIAVASRGVNITEKKRSEIELLRRKKMLRSIFNEMPDAMLLVNAFTKETVMCNKSAVSLFQVDSEEELMTTKPINFRADPISAAEMTEIDDFLTKKGEWKSELRYVSKKGREFWGAIVIRRIEVFDVVYNLVRVMDITHRVKERENMMAFIDMKKRDLANQQKQKNLSLIINGQEQERQRFSKELHDGIGQSLTAIRLQVSAIERESAADFDAQKTKIKKTIDNTISEVKRISHNLMPSAIEDFGLVAALEHMCSLVPSNMGIQFEFDPQMGDIKLSKKQQFAIYRIAQEAVNNAVKYSVANKILVTYGFNQKNELQLKVEDNGKGFKHDKVINFYEHHTIGSGLNNMKERADLIGAHFEIYSELGKGTRILLVLKMEDMQEEIQNEE